MTGCTDSSVSLVGRQLDQTIEKLAPAVEDLLQRVSGAEQVVSKLEGSDIRVTAPLRFPDSIGQGQVVAQLFRWRETVRIDIEIAHNRVFANADGSPSDRKCFFNDYQASVTLSGGSRDLPADFQRQVIAGVSASREAVQRHNRLHQQPWNQVTVAAHG